MTDNHRRGGRASIEQQTLDRVKRIETRITTMALALGVNMPMQKPTFDKQPGEHATLDLPSINTTVKSIRAALPNGFTGRVILRIGGEMILTMDV